MTYQILITDTRNGNRRFTLLPPTNGPSQPETFDSFRHALGVLPICQAHIEAHEKAEIVDDYGTVVEESR